MIIQDAVRNNPDFNPNTPQPKYLEASAIMAELNQPDSLEASRTVVTSMNTQPPKSDVHLEVSGREVGTFLRISNATGTYPKAAVKALHVRKPLTPTLALQGFHTYIKNRYNTDVQLNPPAVPENTIFHSLAVMHMQIHYNEVEQLLAAAQVHYNRDGVAHPHDIAVILKTSDNHWGDPLAHMGSLKDLALAIFGRYALAQFDTETRIVKFETLSGPHPMPVEYMLP